tara:strand:+ start:1285 stop:1683 length:399 start_codon:yes stop_codon:yes gene_type:complete
MSELRCAGTCLGEEICSGEVKEVTIRCYQGNTVWEFNYCDEAIRVDLEQGFKVFHKEKRIYSDEQAHEELIKEKQRREEAEKVLEFYAEETNWYGAGSSRLAILTDTYSLGFCNDVGGKKARAYLDKYKDDK